MIQKSEILADLLNRGGKDPFVINPPPDYEEGAASIDLRLGCWIAVARHSHLRALDVYDDAGSVPGEPQLLKMHYVPFGRRFVLHPRHFVLGVTLEWIRFPSDLAGYVIGKSSWGRYGLRIATATGVHPGFTGCLTLELTNVGEVPIAITPGTRICQVFIHDVKGKTPSIDQSPLIGRRKPTLLPIRVDETTKTLSNSV
jgi:dCTP deaminase